MARLEEIGPYEIPANVGYDIWQLSGMYTAADRCTPATFNRLLHIEADGIESFVAEHTKTYRQNHETESITYVIDTDTSGVTLGKGEIRLSRTNDSDFYKNKPFVGQTTTTFEYRRQGLGLRRLHVMNMASLAIHGLPLHSDTLRSRQAQSLWEKLVEQGVAQRYMQANPVTGKSCERYCFIQQ